MRRPTYDADAFGSFAEQFARFMGTARFLIYMTLFVVVWLGWNWLAPEDLAWDLYPFIFLTLMLSLQASYAAPLILLAQNRQEDRDRVIAERDRQANARAHADMEFLAREVASLRMAIGEVATRDYVRSELRALLAELDEKRSPDRRARGRVRRPRARGAVDARARARTGDRGRRRGRDRPHPRRRPVLGAARAVLGAASRRPRRPHPPSRRWSRRRPRPPAPGPARRPRPTRPRRPAPT